MNESVSGPKGRAPRRRLLRRFRYSLRGLLLVVTVAAIALGWYCHRAREQKRAVESIKALGGHVFYHGGEKNTPAWLWRLSRLVGQDWLLSVTAVNLSRADVEKGDLECLKCLPRLKRLWLSQTGITDARLEPVASLRNLRFLHLHRTCVTDAGLARIARLKKLESLYLSNTQVTDAGVRYLKDLSAIRCLHLAETSVTEKSLPHLRGLKNLRTLDLRETQVAGPELAGLAELANLEYLLLSNTPVCDEDIEPLKQLHGATISLGGTQVSEHGLSSLGKRVGPAYTVVIVP
jgi:hypothetical protein